MGRGYDVQGGKFKVSNFKGEMWCWRWDDLLAWRQLVATGDGGSVVG